MTEPTEPVTDLGRPVVAEPTEPSAVSVAPEVADAFAHWAQAIPFTAKHEKMIEEIHAKLTAFENALNSILPMAEQLAPMLGIQIPK